MEEKNRYIYTKIDGYYWIKDTETNENYCVDKKIVNLLNQQDKEIKTLKTKFEDRKRFCISQVKCQQALINKLLEENQQLKERISKQLDRIQILTKTCDVEKEFGDKMFEKNQLLKQQLEEKEKKIEKLSLYSEKLYKLQARIGLEEMTVGDVVEELDRLRNQLELSQKENQQFKKKVADFEKLLYLQKKK